MKYFPIYLDLISKNILIVGTGHEAEQKLSQLLETGACIKMISETRPAYINKFEEFNNFKFEMKNFTETDLENIWLVVSTLEDRSINEYVFKEATKQNIFCNVVDVTDLCSFIFPAIVTQGDVNISISTSGTSPALAQNIKEKITELIGPEYGALAGILGNRRKEIVEKIPSREERSRLFHLLVNSGSLELLKRNRNYEAELLISEIIEGELKEILSDTRLDESAI